jgi:leucyl aminopeptidase
VSLNPESAAGDPAAPPRALHLVSELALAGWLQAQTPEIRVWVRSQGFTAERQRMLPLPAANGSISAVVFGLGAADLAAPDPWWFACLPERLPLGTYQLASQLGAPAATALALGWQLGSYRLARWRGPAALQRSELLLPPGADRAWVDACGAAISLARDLINAPPNEMGPAELADAISAVASAHGASCKVIVGPMLTAAGYPLVQAVGAGSPREPRMIELRWGREEAPLVTLIGKGVCFDSGGLDIKEPAGMLLMKKDMAGAACALATAVMIMSQNAPVQLRLLVPAVENSVDGLAYRPSDILRSRKGLTVEIGNTDAEGRLVLADALAAADEASPALIVDFATLTGAARVALGPELPAAFSTDENLLEQLRRCGDLEHDPVWPMPLWSGYEEDFGSKLADVNNVASHAFAGAIVAALFLKRFVTHTSQWLHLDLYGWNAKDRPGRPVGGEVQCSRAVYRLIRQRFG